MSPQSHPQPVNWSSADPHFRPNRRRRGILDPLFHWICFFATFLGVVFLGTVLGSVFLRVLYPAGADAKTGISLVERMRDAGLLLKRLVLNTPGVDASEVGYRVGLIGSAWLLLFVILIAVPVGVGAALYLEEYTGKSRWKTLVQTKSLYQSAELFRIKPSLSQRILFLHRD